jgi:renalase
LTAVGRRFAVIGAGIAGLACARALREADAAVTVFEREAVPGGRAATLIEEAGPYDHGAQYFTAGEARFVIAARRWQADEIVEPWRGRIVAFEQGGITEKTESAERLVAVPGMRRLGLYLAQGIDVRYATPIGRVQRSGGGWFLRAEGPDGAAFGPFDAVCVAVPSAVAAPLLDGLTELVEPARTIRWDPCWAVALALAQPSGADFDGAFINDDPILGWVARDSAKPRRGRVEGVAERWVLHAKPSWSRRFYDLEEIEAARWLARSFSARLRRGLNPVHIRAVRWPHGTPQNPLAQRCLWDEALAVGMAGDWCSGPRIEGAYLSGLALGEAATASQ